MSTRKDQLLRRAAGQKGRAVALTREEKALRAFLEKAAQEHAQSGGGSSVRPDLSNYYTKDESDNRYLTEETQELPDVTADNEGSFLRVVNGAWVAAKISNAEEASF